MKKVAGIILAAGTGARMGGAVKQMLPFRGATMLQQVVENAVAASLQDVVVVLGHCAGMIEPAIAGRGASITINSDYLQGQSTSVKAGLKVLPDDIDAVLFLLGDQPLVTPETIHTILDAFQNSAAPIVMPVCNGRRGNPVLFSRETFPRLESLDGDCGARAIFSEFAGRILEVEVDDESILRDIDTEEDYQRLLQMEQIIPIPDQG